MYIPRAVGINNKYTIVAATLSKSFIGESRRLFWLILERIISEQKIARQKAS